jgi:HK97 family phage prohead protease
MKVAVPKKEKIVNKVFNLTSTFKALDQDDDSIVIGGMASTKDFDRAGDTILPEAWAKGGLHNFEKNPIILFNHDYNKPIGRAIGLKVTDDGLELKAKISKSAPDSVASLVKEGILGAFSVGFRIKDADYLEETDGLKIKDAELFEVSVVSVPCNQAATFSLAKSFDSERDYEDFKKTFKSEEDSSLETNMSEVNTPEIDLDSFAKKVAEETAAKIAIKQAEEKAVAEAQAKAAEEAEAAKAAQQDQIQSAIKMGIESGADRLMSDIKADMEAQKQVDVQEIVSKYQRDLEEKNAELEAMRNSKKDFSGRKSSDLSQWGKEILQAKILGQVTGRGWDTDFARELQEKTVDFSAAGSSVGLDVSMSTAFEVETGHQYKVAQLFREIPVQSGATVLPFAAEPGLATFSTEGISKPNAADQNLLTDNADSNYTVTEKILNAKRVIAGTFINSDTDEQIIVNLLPMLTTQLATAHARAIDSAILVGNSSIAGLVGGAGTDGGGSFLSTDSTLVADKDASLTDGTDVVSAGDVLKMRSEMGKYGMDPTRLALILPYDQYYELMDDSGFTDISEVGSDAAAGRGINPRVSGVLGYIYGVPVVASEFLANQLAATGAATTTAACLVNTDAFVIPRLRGVSIQSDFEVARQRTAIVASQSLGFERLQDGAANNRVAVRIEYA